MRCNDRLRLQLLTFLSDHSFERSEFKIIHSTFVMLYPEFKSKKKYYAKIYQAVRELEAEMLFVIDRTTCTYKYTSISNREKFSQLINNLIGTDSVKNQLLMDYQNVKSEAQKIKSELAAFYKYIKQYPILKNKLTKPALDRRNNLIRLESELTVLNIIIQQIS